jgi:limonene-1,2-epoxide hydrolase
MEPSPANEALVRRFCEAFPRRDVDELLAFFAEGATYHNIPFPPAVGTDAIRATLESFVPASPTLEFVLLHVASAGNVVFTERIDKLSFGGREVELPVAGVFEVEGDRITAWRDYFDVQQLMGSGQA